MLYKIFIGLTTVTFVLAGNSDYSKATSEFHIDKTKPLFFSAPTLRNGINIFRDGHQGLSKKEEFVCELNKRYIDCHKLAIHHAQEGDKMLYFFPNFKNELYKNTILSNSLTWACIKDLKTKLLAIATCMIGIVIIDLRDQWNEMKEHYLKAAFYADMEEFYRDAISKVNIENLEYYGSLFWKGIQALIRLE